MLILLGFWSYLWGIETLFKPQLIYSSRSFDLTYEGLKLQYPPPRATFWIKSFDLTYEGLKHCFRIWFWDEKSSVLILPMRDWNTENESRKFQRGMCFDLTYEGLKRALSKKVNPVTFSFDLTYEGLKPSNPWWLLGDNRCFDLTYEGLKQRISFPIRDRRLIVLILPMRDWNPGVLIPWPSSIASFDLTYEGLKQPFVLNYNWVNH